MPTPIPMHVSGGDTPSQPTTFLTFAQMIERVLDGCKARRAEWQDAGVYVFMGPFSGKNTLMIHIKRVVPAETVGQPAREEWVDNALAVSDGDMLGEDWVVVP